MNFLKVSVDKMRNVARELRKHIVTEVASIARVFQQPNKASNEDPPNLKIFFSHRTSDIDRVRELKNELCTLLPSLQLDDLSVQVPQSDGWKDIAADLLRCCDAVVCLVGPKTHESPEVAWELQEAQRNGKPILVTRIEPAHCLHASCEEIAAHDTEYQPKTIAQMLMTYSVFAKHDWSKGDPSPESVWNQYQLMVQTSEALVQRRQTMNTVYMTANTAVIAGIGVLVSSDSHFKPLSAAFGALLLSCVGALLSFNWRRTIESYGLLNTAKFKVISAFERYLPARIFDAEWALLEAAKYTPTTRAEMQSAALLQLLFCVLFVVSAAVACTLLIAW